MPCSALPFPIAALQIIICFPVEKVAFPWLYGEDTLRKEERMNDTERTRIQKLQSEGLGYKKIATITGLPVNTVKTFCRRNPVLVSSQMSRQHVCRYCGKPVTQVPHKREKQFCSDKCRMAWWREHPADLNRKAFYQIKCQGCGTVFDSYGNQRRKYCSWACYNRARQEGDCHGQ